MIINSIYLRFLGHETFVAHFEITNNTLYCHCSFVIDDLNRVLNKLELLNVSFDFLEGYLAFAAFITYVLIH